MNLFTRLFIFTIIISFIVSSCQKPLTDPNPTSPVSGDSTLLSKYIELDTTVAAPFDTISLIKYSYDNLKRCTGFNYYEYNGASPYDYLHKFSFSYNGTNDIKLTQKIVSYHGTIMTDSTINYYLYNSNGDMITDSSQDLIAGSTEYIKHFVYAGNVITTYVNIITDSSVIKTHFTKTNNNITAETDTSYYQGSYRGSTSYTASYDTHQNPFYKVYVPVPYLGVDLVISTDATQKNNTVQSIQTTPGFQFTHLYEYKYNTINYPTKVKITGQSATGSTFYVKGLFYYTN